MKAQRSYNFSLLFWAPRIGTAGLIFGAVISSLLFLFSAFGGGESAEAAAIIGMVLAFPVNTELFSNMISESFGTLYITHPVLNRIIQYFSPIILFLVLPISWGSFGIVLGFVVDLVLGVAEGLFPRSNT